MRESEFKQGRPTGRPFAFQGQPMTDIRDRIRIHQTTTLSKQRYELKSIEFAWHRRDGEWQSLKREVYEKGNGATILLTNRARRSVVLIRQFRLPTFLNGYREELIEAAAGMLDDATPEDRIRAEVEEETGYTVHHVEKVFEAFMSPGALSEKLYFFIAEYDPASRAGEGGGLKHEGEDITVLELPFDDAMAMIGDGRICDAKTIMLLQHAKLTFFA
jgi:nudix-type nucleoside diphosphatase (YffH/AdpP family)